MKDDPTNGLPPICTIEEVATFLRLGRSHTYELARTGILPAIRLGRSLRIPRAALLAWLETTAQGGQSENEAAGASWQARPAASVEGARSNGRPISSIR
jgi:excisionase family DNA binding protein